MFIFVVFNSLVVHQKRLVQCVNMKLQRKSTIDRAVLKKTKKWVGNKKKGRVPVLQWVALYLLYFKSNLIIAIVLVADLQKQDIKKAVSKESRPWFLN